MRPAMTPAGGPDPRGQEPPPADGDRPRGDDALLAAAFRAAPYAQAILSPEATIAHVNPAACALVGYTEAELVGQNMALLAGADSLVEVAETFLQLMNGDVPSARLDLNLQRKDGTLLAAEAIGAPLLGPDGRPTAIIVMALDVTERLRHDRQVLHQALHDNLTELPNRAWFAERLQQAISRVDRGAGLLAVYFVDLDGFKAINDTFGHTVGDETLFVAAGRIRSHVRPADTVARHSGDEFTVLCEDLESEAHAADIAERILASFSRPCRVSGGEVNVRASIGVALAVAGATPAALIAAADAAMYQAKAAGKATFRFARPASP